MPGEHMLNSTKGFIDRVKEFVFGSDDVLISFDVESLFTNVPLKEINNLIADAVYSNPDDCPPFSITVFKNMMKLATGGFFINGGKLYTQIDGVAMGSPLGPTLAFSGSSGNKQASWSGG